MPLLNLSQAARAAGVSRSQLYRMNEAGRISFTQRPNGQPAIDTSELLRVFGELQSTGENDTSNNQGQNSARQAGQQETVRTVLELQAENRRLVEVLELTRRMLQTAEERLHQADERLAKADAERAQLMLLIPTPASRQIAHQPVKVARRTPAKKAAAKKTPRRVAATPAKAPAKKTIKALAKAPAAKKAAPKRRA